MGKRDETRVNLLQQRFAIGRIVALAILAISLSTLGSQHAASTPAPQFNVTGARSANPPVDDTAAESAFPTFRKGDIILMQTGTTQGMVVSASDPQTEYSHCAIVVAGGTNDPDAAFAVHATPARLDEQGNRRGGEVQRVAVGALLADPGVQRWRIYRVKDGHAAHVAAASEWALAAAAKAIPFDGALDLENPDKLYCSELIWRAYKEAGLDLLDGQFDKMRFAFGSRRVIYPGSLVRGQAVQPVLSQSRPDKEHTR